ncbi:tRNA (guanosine(46)-N7)-methyltransferase TrmB [Algihabitans sp.]|uniref:tRNA (guanosine(46)-N7)-methyltransferase TrmB n=1 Tax=Algihabitans sp. TaxID=2821514 RepID=UPI003BA88A3F
MLRPKLHGRRKGRPLRTGLQRLMTEVLPQLAVTLPESGSLDLQTQFGSANGGVWLEIGFGGGEHLAWQARENPDIGIIGCEVFENGVASLLRAVERDALENVRIAMADARLLLERLPAGSLARAFLLFPDPWPKRRHASRRFLQRETLDLLAQAMRDGAELRAASDDPKMQAWMLKQLLESPDFIWTARAAADAFGRPDDWPGTRYEAKAVAAGRRPIYLKFRRRPRV